MQDHEISTHDGHRKLWLPNTASLESSSLQERQQLMQDRIKGTQAVLPNEIFKGNVPQRSGNESHKKMTFKKASQVVINRQRHNLQISDVVSNYLKMKAEESAALASSVEGIGDVSMSEPDKTQSIVSAGLHRRCDTNSHSGKCGSIPLQMWRQIVQEGRTSVKGTKDVAEDSV